jgi:hypothetical protein
MERLKENNAQLGSEQSKTVSVILENDVGLVFSADSIPRGLGPVAKQAKVPR